MKWQVLRIGVTGFELVGSHACAQLLRLRVSHGHTSVVELVLENQPSPRVDSTVGLASSFGTEAELDGSWSLTDHGPSFLLVEKPTAQK